MKKFFLGFITALVLVALVYFGQSFIRGFFGGGGPIAPEQLNPEAKDFGALKVEIFGAGKPVKDLEVDLGEPGGRMSYTMTDNNGVALFEKVSIGVYSIFFNDVNYPKEFVRVSSPISVKILKDQTTEKRIELNLR